MSPDARGMSSGRVLVRRVRVAVALGGGALLCLLVMRGNDELDRAPRLDPPIPSVSPEAHAPTGREPGRDRENLQTARGSECANLRIVIRDEVGQAVPRAAVTLRLRARSYFEASTHPARGALVSNEEGLIECPYPASEVDSVVVPGRGGWVGMTMAVDPGVHEVGIVLTRALPIVGRVTDEDGTPLEGALLGCWGPDSYYAETVSRAEGAFRFYTASGDVVIRALGVIDELGFVDWYACSSAPVQASPGTQKLVVRARRIRRVATLRVRVCDPRGEPFTRATVYVHHARMDPVPVNCEGWAILESVPDTSLLVEARPDSSVDQERALVRSRAVAVDPSRETPTLFLRAAVAIEGRMAGLAGDGARHEVVAHIEREEVHLGRVDPEGQFVVLVPADEVRHWSVSARSIAEDGRMATGLVTGVRSPATGLLVGLSE